VGSGAGVLGIDDSEQRAIEMERVCYPGIIIVSFPVICCFMSVLVLGTLPWLIGAYNYLRGASSPIDQVILALLGSDSSRLVVLASSIIGIMLGLYLSRFVTTKLDVVKKEGEAELSTRMYTALLVWWVFPQWSLSIISLLDMSFNGFYTSKFLSDLGFFMMAGYFLAYSIPVLLKYVLLVRYTRSISSQIILVGLPRGGSGFKKRFQNLTLRIIHVGPDP
jgi:hypothetical protein